MSSEQSAVNETLEAIRRQLDDLSGRLATLESRVSHLSEAPPEPAKNGRVVDEHLLAVLSAACAAYLGHHSPIREVRVLGSVAWLQMGRSGIQTSRNRLN
jgi:hypothetical protein